MTSSRWMLLLAVLALMVCCPSSASTQSSSLLENGDFSQVVGGLQPASWWYDRSALTYPGQVVTSGVPTQVGEGLIAPVAPALKSIVDFEEMTYCQSITVTADFPYSIVVRGWIASPNGLPGTIEVAWFDGANPSDCTTVDKSQREVIGAAWDRSRWEPRVEVIDRPATPYDYVAVYLWAEGEDVYFDDISVFPNDTSAVKMTRLDAHAAQISSPLALGAVFCLFVGSLAWWQRRRRQNDSPHQ